jgi:hypothetical protein
MAGAFLGGAAHFGGMVLECGRVLRARSFAFKKPTDMNCCSSFLGHVTDIDHGKRIND